MLPYAAYLRVYEPVTAFPEPARTLWTAYADSRRRPERAHALQAEQQEAMRRLVASPPVVAPDRESVDAYVRRLDDTLYVCPWEIRLRSWHAYARFREETSAYMASCYMPPEEMRRVDEAFEAWRAAGNTARPHILSSTWHVPAFWFTLFNAAERCLVLGRATGEKQRGRGPATAAATRTLIYVTTLAAARGRAEAALPYVPDPGHLETVVRWLAGFHPGALVELDYGGLVHLVDDEFLRTDASVAETEVAVAAAARGQTALATAMRRRLRARWDHVRALESAN